MTNNFKQLVESIIQENAMLNESRHDIITVGGIDYEHTKDPAKHSKFMKDAFNVRVGYSGQRGMQMSGSNMTMTGRRPHVQAALAHHYMSTEDAKAFHPEAWGKKESSIQENAMLNESRHDIITVGGIDYEHTKDPAKHSKFMKDAFNVRVGYSGQRGMQMSGSNMTMTGRRPHVQAALAHHYASNEDAKAFHPEAWGKQK